jgi:hypothetical protein
LGQPFLRSSPDGQWTLAEKLMVEAAESFGVLGVTESGTFLISATMLRLQMNWPFHRPVQLEYRLAASFESVWDENWSQRLAVLMVSW